MKILQVFLNIKKVILLLHGEGVNKNPQLTIKIHNVNKNPQGVNKNPKSITVHDVFYTVMGT